MQPHATAETTLDLLFERYAARLVNRGRKPDTIDNFRYGVTPFQAWLNEQHIKAADVTTEHLEEYFNPATNPYAQGTRRLHATQVRAAYSLAHRRGMIRANPFADFELPALPEPTRDTLSTLQLRLGYAGCRNWRQTLLWHFLVWTGMRKDEIRRATWADVDMDGLTLHVVGKGDKPRTVPMHPELQRVLIDTPRPPGKPDGPVLWTTSRIEPYAKRGSSFRDLLSAFDPDHGFHVYRKTVATSLFRNGVPGDTIDRILGWAPAGIRARYYLDVRMDDLHRAILRLYADDPLRV